MLDDSLDFDERHQLECEDCYSNIKTGEATGFAFGGDPHIVELESRLELVERELAELKDLLQIVPAIGNRRLVPIQLPGGSICKTCKQNLCYCGQRQDDGSWNFALEPLTEDNVEK